MFRSTSVITVSANDHRNSPLKCMSVVKKTVKGDVFFSQIFMSKGKHFPSPNRINN